MLTSLAGTGRGGPGQPAFTLVIVGAISYAALPVFLIVLGRLPCPVGRMLIVGRRELIYERQL
jgi:hypothetical protein